MARPLPLVRDPPLTLTLSPRAGRGESSRLRQDIRPAQVRASIAARFPSLVCSLGARRRKAPPPLASPP